MAAFNADTWQKRALSRKRPKSHEATRALCRDLEALDGIARLQRWLAARGWKLTFNSEPNGSCIHADREIEVNSRCRAEAQLFYLVHECGHLLQGPTKPMGPGRVFDDEYNAWQRGEKLARRLKISFDRGMFDRRRHRALRTYFW